MEPHGGSPYERLEIESLLRGVGYPPRVPPRPGSALVLMPEAESFAQVCHAAVLPALRANGLNRTGMVRVFDSASYLDGVYAEISTAEVVLADVTGRNADLLYVLGLCHGLGRCPLLVGQPPIELPFDLRALRHVEYDPTPEGVRRLRHELERAVRVFLAARRAKPAADDESDYGEVSSPPPRL